MADDRWLCRLVSRHPVVEGVYRLLHPPSTSCKTLRWATTLTLFECLSSALLAISSLDPSSVIEVDQSDHQLCAEGVRGLRPRPPTPLTSVSGDSAQRAGHSSGSRSCGSHRTMDRPWVTRA
ncbi:hypothetical protein J6590_060495 [Homalodisca vitripennis]|nr:hypothetical protein J6590_060495 [Homalodisca vitripennis]